MLSLWIFSHLMLSGMFQAGDAIYPKEGPSVSWAERSEFPYMVMVFDVPDDNSFHSCAGAIIDRTHILTAAHCVFYSLPERIVILAGGVYRRINGNEKFRVATIHVPEELKDNRHKVETWFENRVCTDDDWQNIRNEIKCSFSQNDIAVLTLSSALSFRDNIQAVNLPDSNDLPYCQFCKFSGWGQNERNGPCAERLHWTRLIILKDPINGMKDFREFLAKDPMLETCPLEGDSGAPLVFNNTVYGVLNRNYRNPHSPSTFSKVFAHINFIRKALEN